MEPEKTTFGDALSGSSLVYIDTEAGTVRIENVHKNTQYTISIHEAMKLKEIMGTRVETVTTYRLRNEA